MSIVLEQRNPKTRRFEQVTDLIFANVSRGKVVRNVSRDDNTFMRIEFTDRSTISVQEDRGHGITRVFFAPSPADDLNVLRGL